MNHAAHQLPVHCICRVCVYDYACYNISWVCLGVSYLISLWVMTHMCFDSDTGVERVLYGVSNIRLYTHHLRVKPYRVRPLRYSVFSISRDWSRSGIKSCNCNNQIWDLSRNKWYLSQSGCGIKSGIHTTFLARNCGSVAPGPRIHHASSSYWLQRIHAPGAAHADRGRWGCGDQPSGTGDPKGSGASTGQQLAQA